MSDEAEIDDHDTGTVALLKGMYAAETRYLAAGGPGEASFDELAGFFDPDVVLRQADSLPYGGVWRGHAGMERFMTAMSETWTEFEMLEQSFLGEGNPMVVLTWVRARAAAGGRELEFPILQTITVGEAGIVEVRPFYWDVAEIARACGSAAREAGGRRG